MNIFCNGELITAEPNASLYDILAMKALNQKKGIAVALNNTVIKKDEWKTCTLQENDKILIISATKGG
ncbi:MAG: sulfur carrier protein ThiS [Bacteroidota bacterium]